MVRPMQHDLLNQEELSSYNERGYFLYRKQLFDGIDLAALDGIFREHRAMEGEKRGDEFDTPHFEDRRLLDYLLAPTVLDLVECIIGPNIVLWSSHFISKDPYIGRATPWHEDSTYWIGRLDRYDKLVTVWLALDDVDTRQRLHESHSRIAPERRLFFVPQCRFVRRTPSARRSRTSTPAMLSHSNYCGGNVLCTMGAYNMGPMPTRARDGVLVTRCVTYLRRSTSTPRGTSGTGSGWPGAMR